MPTTYEEIEDEVALGGPPPSQPQVATRTWRAIHDDIDNEATRHLRKARSAKDANVRAQDTGKSDATTMAARLGATEARLKTGKTMDTPEIARKKALATDLARLNRKKRPKKVDKTNQKNISKAQGVLMKMIDKGASDAVVGKQIDFIEALTNREEIDSRDFQHDSEYSYSSDEPQSQSAKPGSLKDPIAKRRKRNLIEEELNLQTAFPAAEPRAQLPRDLRRDRGIDIEKIVKASQTVHPSYDPMQTNELDKHHRIINRTNGTKKPSHPPKRSIEARVGLHETLSPPPKAVRQTLNEENLRLQNGDGIMQSIENWQELLTEDGSEEDTEEAGATMKVLDRDIQEADQYGASLFRPKKRASGQ